MNGRTQARLLLVLWLLVCLALIIVGFKMNSAAADRYPPTNGRTLPACTSEDGSYGPKPCVWLAVEVNEMPAIGNGTGDSFRVYHSGRIKTISDRRAYQLLHGMPNHDRRAGQVDTRKCATMPEFKRLPEQDGKQAVERFIETRGWVVYRQPGFVVKHYEFCDHPIGWLTVSYTKRAYEKGWNFDNKVLIYTCTHQSGDGPVVPCDNTVVNYIEAALLNSNKSGVLKAVKL